MEFIVYTIGICTPKRIKDKMELIKKGIKLM